MWQKKKISVIFPCKNEGQNIRNAINDFFKNAPVDEIIVVDHFSTDNTKSETLKTKAKYVNEEEKGYGYALIRGLSEATGDYIFTCEPDGTFVAKDILKFLAYSDEFDVIFGTRTSKALIWENANMKFFLRFGNTVVAKYLEYLHNGPCLTDVGCTFKFIKKDALKKIIDKFTVGGSHFSPEFMILCLKNKLKCVEIPVNYRSRVGESKITGKFSKAFKLGIIMIGLITGYWLGITGKKEKIN